MPLALLLNPSTGSGPWGKTSSRRKARREKNMARRKRMPRRGRGGRFVKGGRRVRRARNVRLVRSKLFSRPRRKRHSRKHNPVVHRSKRISGFKRVRRKVYTRTRRHNPFAIMGRKGSFGLIPDMQTIKDGAVKGLGAVAADVVRASAYSLIGRTPNQSIAEDFVARLLSGWVTGTAAGYILGQEMANDIYEGNLVVSVYELAADAAAAATQGQAKLFGFVANPYAGRASKPFLPSFAFGSAAPAVASSGGVAGLGAVVPEGSIVPIGGVIPEGDVLPLGTNRRFASRF